MAGQENSTSEGIEGNGTDATNGTMGEDGEVEEPEIPSIYLGPLPSIIEKEADIDDFYFCKNTCLEAGHAYCVS